MIIYKGCNICILFAISILLAACQQDADIVIPEVADNDDLATSSYLAETGTALVNATLSAEVDKLNNLVYDDRKTLDIKRITSGTFDRSVRFNQATIDFLYPQNIKVGVKDNQLLLCKISACDSNEYKHVGYEFFPSGTDYIQPGAGSGGYIQLAANSYFKLLNLTSLSNVQITLTLASSMPADSALHVYYGNYGIKITQNNIYAAYNRFNLANVGTNNSHQSYGAEIVLTMCGLHDPNDERSFQWKIGEQSIISKNLDDQLMPNDPNLVDLFFISKHTDGATDTHNIQINDIEISSVSSILCG